VNIRLRCWCWKLNERLACLYDVVKCTALVRVHGHTQKSVAGIGVFQSLRGIAGHGGILLAATLNSAIRRGHAYEKKEIYRVGKYENGPGNVVK
jgi:hypothetical protein